MSRPWQDFPRRGPAGQMMQDSFCEIYAGPEGYMEPGSRGFLINTLIGKEEFAIDDALVLLRQAAIKLYGGIKPKKKGNPARGYVKIDFMDPEAVTVLPTPPGEEDEDDENDQEEEATEHEKLNGGLSTEQAGKTTVGEKKELEKKAGKEDKTGANKTDDKTGTGKTDDKTGASKTDDKTGVIKTDEATAKTAEENPEEKKEEPKKEVPCMRSSYKFKAFRTEIKNMMFIKSDVPDPTKVVDAAMEIILTRKTVSGDAVRQLLPVHGVCQYDTRQFDSQQVEVMTQRVLSPILNESQEPKGFSVFLMDKLSDPGSDLLIEIIRNCIWAINPSAYQASPLTEPDIVIRLEIIGKKLVLSCLTHFMKYRHYNPKLLVDAGVGEAEDDDGTWTPSEVRKMQELIKAEKEKRRELERQRDEEIRKEREKRREEAEARRLERMKEREKERQEREKEREKERQIREKERQEREKERQEREKEKHNKDEKKESAKQNEKEQPKDESSKKAEPSTDKEQKPEEGQSTEQKSEEKPAEQDEGKKPRTRKSGSAETPPAKKQKLEEANTPKEVEPEKMEVSEEGGGDVEETAKAGAQTKKGSSRRRSVK